MPKTIGNAVEWYALNTPDKLAVLDSRAEEKSGLTYSQFWDRICRGASALHALGVGPGDRVALLMANSVRYVEAYHAIAVLGASVVPLNFRYVAAEIDYVVNHSEATALLFDAAFDGIVSELDGHLKTVKNNLIVTDAILPGKFNYEELLKVAPPWAPEHDVNADGCFYQGYTSGTTGFPKGCVNLHGRFVDFFKRCALLYNINPKSIEIVCAPLFHEAPTLFMMTQIFHGGTVVVTDDPTPANILKSIERHKVTWGFMVPTMWDGIISSGLVEKYDLSSMKILVSAGAPLMTHTKEALLECFPDSDLNEFYGATEVGIVTNLAGCDQRRKVRSVGRTIPGFHVKLVDDNGGEVKKGETGEIWIRGPILIREYFNNIEATNSARHGDWFTLSDMGRFDDEGFLYIVDRKKDMIITGGENVYPAEVEAVLSQHLGVLMCAVVGIPDKKWGEIIYAAVVLRPGATVTPSDLENHCSRLMARFKVPKRIDLVLTLPMSSFGKILRREVRKPFWEGQSTAV
jgi:acyl-CoA synthetase (AMP-forming)/AMP-acid ligase II